MTTYAYDACIDGIYYNFIDKAKIATVTNNGDEWSGSYSGDVVIPSKVAYNGVEYTVTSIGEYTFRRCNSAISVTIPNTVTTIETYAFRACHGLSSIIIPNSVTSIGSGAFENCGKLASVTIPNSVTTICEYAFRDCPSLTSITIPSSVTSIEGYAFYNCTNLASVIIPNSVTNIGSFAFYLCQSLANISIPNSVQTIDNNAFAYCSALDNVTIPSSVTTIGKEVFYKCTSLTSMTIPNSVTSMGTSVFSGCSALTSVALPNTMKRIEMSTFRDCSSLTSVSIPNSVTSIKSSAFQGCSSLTSIVIPNTVTSIEAWTFWDCSSLASVVIPNTVTALSGSAFQNCTSLTSVTIPNSVATIGSEAFRGCSNLSSVSIGSGVKTISNNAFADCKELADVHCYSSVVPKTTADAFNGSMVQYATLYIPEGWDVRGTVWESFGTIIQENAPVIPTDWNLTDGEEYLNIYEYENRNITYTRDFTNTNWQALYVPFSIPVSMLEEKGLKIAELNDTHQKDYDGDGIADETTIEFFTLTSGETQPNYPYMIKAEEAGEVVIELEDATLYAASSTSIDCSTVKQVFTFTGTYTGVSGEDMFNNNFYALAGGSIARPENNTVSLKPQRWYMSIASRDGSPVQYFAPSVRISVDGFEEEGMQTMINEVVGASEEDAIYTLDGKRISGNAQEALKPGLYVQGGKKFMVK